jgi:magnesium transporter
MAVQIVELSSSASGFRWIDISNPSLKDLQKIANQYGLHKTAVRDCLQPEHLPKYENQGKIRFVMLRCYDSGHAADASDITELTRKVALFICDELLITIHRKDFLMMKALREKWEPRLKDYPGNPRAHLVIDIIHDCLESFDAPLDECFEKVEKLEEFAFGIAKQKLDLSHVYNLKRQSSAYKRLLWLTNDVIKRFSSDAEVRADEQSKPYILDIKEDLENTIFYVDDLNESLNQLLNLYLAQESQRTNEAMRVLTVFSAFFMPITFVVGVYGMNFHHMPELGWEYGYPACLLFMALISAAIFIWFKKKRWL